jgi:uncharacterized protein
MNNTQELRENLRRILAEWHDFTLPDPIERDGGNAALGSSRIVSVIGPRRAGKTWVCFQVIRKALAAGMPRSNVVYINFEDERLHPLTGQELTDLLETQEELFPAQKGHGRICVLDEVQNVPNWSKWVRRAADQNRDLTIILTGSSSKMLSSEIATELRGRTAVVTVFPFSFREFARAKQAVLPEKQVLFHGRHVPVLKRIFHEYMERGGFPETLKNTDIRPMLQQYYRAMFARDMIERHAVPNPRMFEDYLTIQTSRFAALSSSVKLEGELRSLGYSLNRNMVMNYLGYAKDAFLLFDVPKYDHKISVQLRNPRKIYAVDQGLLNAIRFSASEDRGRILENMVFLELNRRKPEGIYYHAGNGECDFLIVRDRKIESALQVCWSLASKETFAREVRGLVSALTEHKIPVGMIVTSDTRTELEQDGKNILVRPFWEFALS